jgi:hypothetical protein
VSFEKQMPAEPWKDTDEAEAEAKSAEGHVTPDFGIQE